MTFLNCDGNIVTSNRLKINETVRCITNKPYASKGKWYFEVSNDFGEDNHILAVWRIKNNGYFGYYSTSNENVPLIYSYSQGIEIKFINDTSQNNYVYLNFDDVSCDDTVGIGFDIDTRTFYFRIKNHISIFKMNISISGKLSFSPQFFDGSNKGYEDTISVNFGQNNFVYDVPFGFLPWGTSLKYCTCASSRNRSLILMSYLLICHALS